MQIFLKALLLHGDSKVIDITRHIITRCLIVTDYYILIYYVQRVKNYITHVA